MCERTSAGDPSETQHACREAAVVEEARLSVSLLKSLNSVVQGGHHLHLELEVLLRGQGGGISIPVPWLFCPWLFCLFCWSEPRLVFTI